MVNKTGDVLSEQSKYLISIEKIKFWLTVAVLCAAFLLISVLRSYLKINIELFPRPLLRKVFCRRNCIGSCNLKFTQSDRGRVML